VDEQACTAFLSNKSCSGRFATVAAEK